MATLWKPPLGWNYQKTGRGLSADMVVNIHSISSPDSPQISRYWPLTVIWGYLGGPDTQMRAWKGYGFEKISANQNFAPAAQKDPRIWKCLLWSARPERCGEILVLAVIWGCLCGPNARIRVQFFLSLLKYPMQGVALPDPSRGLTFNIDISI